MFQSSRHTPCAVAEPAQTLALESAAARTWDVLVVGAGPAGSIAARELARRGATVLLVDKASFPRSKVCGCCLNGRVLAVLNEVGLGDLVQRLGAQPLSRLELHAGQRQATLELPTGTALSRGALDAALVASAIEAGAQFLPQATARLGIAVESWREVVLSHGAQHATVRSKIVLAADGLSGQLLQDQPKFKLSVRPNGHIGAGAILDESPKTYVAGTVFMAYGRGGYVGLVRLEDGRLDVAAALELGAVRAQGLWEAVSGILQEARLPTLGGFATASWHGTPALTRRRSPVAAHRLLVIGDAAGYLEPFTGEGIAWAMQTALLAAPLMLSGARTWSPDVPRRWISEYGRFIRSRQRTCRLVSMLLRRPRIAAAAVTVLSHAPWLAARWIDAVNGAQPPVLQKVLTTAVS